MGVSGLVEMIACPGRQLHKKNTRTKNVLSVQIIFIDDLFEVFKIEVL